MIIRPERVLKEEGEVSMVEMWYYRDGEPRGFAGYQVHGGPGDASVLHPTLEEAETEFLRRTWV